MKNFPPLSRSKEQSTVDPRKVNAFSEDNYILQKFQVASKGSDKAQNIKKLNQI